MLKQEFPRGRLRGTVAALVMAATMVVPTSATLAMDTADDTGTAEIEPPIATVDELQGQVADLSVANDALLADNTALQRTVDELAAERDALLASLGRFDDLYGPLESDRKLLNELRKDLPETRPEAEAQLDRIRSYALGSDPARLGQLVDRLDESIPTFLDWRFGEWESTQEFSQAYVDTGANAFDSSMQEFRSEVLLSVANRLDGLLTILDRLR